MGLLTCLLMRMQVGLTGFKCRCGFIFCGPHRLAEAHQCDFDWKATGEPPVDPSGICAPSTCACKWCGKAADYFQVLMPVLSCF